MARQKIPATIVTGFLGAGKTTTLRHLLTRMQGKRLALIVNEFGEVGVDGELLRDCGQEACGEEDIVELANGCLCCTVAEDFLPTLKKLIERPNPPDHILIETSGLALPKPLIKAFTWPEVRTRVTVDGVIALVDGPAVAAGLFASDPAALERARSQDPSLDHETPLEELFEEQLGAADLVVINKQDELSPEESLRVQQIVTKELRSGVSVLTASHGRLEPRLLLGLGLAAEEDLANRPSHHDGGEAHDHDDFTSCVIDLPAFSSPEALLARLEPVILEFGLYRVKGFAAIAGKPMRLVVQAVGPRVQHYYDRPWRAAEPPQGRLVAIAATGLDSGALATALRG